MKRLALALVASVLLGGCETLCGGCGAPREHHSSSSLVDFLYPSGALPPAQNTIPQLHVPLRVGLAFLPSRDPSAGPDAALKEQLLARVRQHFSDRNYVSDIVVIPDYYLGTQRGYPGLESLQRLYALDVVALVSYDQVTHTQENNWSLGYITIVGAYVFKGDRYDVSTLVDLAVVDPATRSLILRAGGVDTRRGTATLIDLPQDTRDSSTAAFNAAADQMVVHLDAALADFQTQVRSGHAHVQVVHKDGSKGGAGAFSLGWLLALVPLIVWRARRRLPWPRPGEESDAAAAASVPRARPAARRPSVRPAMRRPRTARSARAIRMRVPRLSVRN